MYNFQKETVINTMAVEGTTQPRVSAVANKLFRVLRCADYVATNLEDKVYKTAAKVGSVATADFEVPTIVGLYRVMVILNAESKYESDFAYPWYKFSKPYFAEFEVKTGMDAAAVQAEMLKVMKAAVPANYQFLLVTAPDADTVRVSTTSANHGFKTAELQVAVNITDDTTYVNSDYVLVSEATIVDNVLPVGTGEWIQENLRFPTRENTRYMAINADETPVMGALYNQYSFNYKVNRKGLGGLSAVGQSIDSVTTHTFYVKSDLATAFELALTTAFGAGVIETIA